MFSRLLHHDGVPVPEPSPDTAKAFLIGYRAWRRGDRGCARALWEAGAESGLPEALCNLANLETTDDPATRQKSEYAHHLWRLALPRLHPAIELDHLQALHEAGEALTRLPEQSTGRGAWLNRRAAKLGHSPAQHDLGVGRLVAGQRWLGYLWLRRAANGGHRRAAVLLANTLAMYACDACLDEALHWLRRGAQAGDPDARAYLAAPLNWIEEAREWSAIPRTSEPDPGEGDASPLRTVH